MDRGHDVKESRIAGPADHLANERTFLAWVRTSIALMGLGFVIVKFGLFINQVAIVIGQRAVVPDKGYSTIVGVTMVALGGVMATVAFLHYRRIRAQLINNEYFPSQRLSALVTLAIVAGSILLVFYLLPNIG